MRPCRRAFPWLSPCQRPGASPTACSACRRRMRGGPVFRDVETPREPHAVVLGHVVEHPLEPGGARWMTDEPEVQAERHHLGLRSALAVEHVEAVLDEREVVVGGEE